MRCDGVHYIDAFIIYFLKIHASIDLSTHFSCLIRTWDVVCMWLHPSSQMTGHCHFLITADASCFLHLHIFKAKKVMRKLNEEGETIPCCSLALYVFPGPGGALSHLCLRRQVLPQLPLLGFPTPSFSLKILFFFLLLQHLLFSPSPSQCDIASLPLFTLWLHVSLIGVLWLIASS